MINFIMSSGCPACQSFGGGFTVTETLIGLSSELSVKCRLCKDVRVLNSSEKVIEPSGASFPEVNSRAVFAATSLGKSNTGLRKFFAFLNIPTPSQKMWDNHNVRIHRAVSYLAHESMMTAALEAKEQAGSKRVTVSCDGTWQKRGFSSNNGVATILSVDNKKVIDVAIRTTYCNICAQQKKKKLPAAEFDEWFAAHQTSGECQQNHFSSSGAMETEGMVAAFRQSEDTRGLVYEKYLGDGDSKSYAAVAKADPPIYRAHDGSALQIDKLECCGHVQKRMGANLLACVSANTGKKFKNDDGKEVSGIGGKGALTKVAVKVIQGHYGGAIRGNVNNVAGMKAAINQILIHRRGIHTNCPAEWCPAVRDNDPVKADKHKLPKYVCDAIEPVFKKLSSDELLEKCAHGGTQNTNESFHSIIWQLVPKVNFVGLRSLQLGVFLATLLYNDGEMSRCNVMRCMGYAPGVHMERFCSELNSTRIKKSIERSDDDFKRHRKEQSLLKTQRADQQTHRDGNPYQPGSC
jgi:hypothetical protein